MQWVKGAVVLCSGWKRKSLKSFMSVLQMDCASEENLGKNAGQNFLNSTVEKQYSRQMSGSAYKTSAGSFTFIRKLKNFGLQVKLKFHCFGRIRNIVWTAKHGWIGLILIPE